MIKERLSDLCQVPSESRGYLPPLGLVEGSGLLGQTAAWYPNNPGFPGVCLHGCVQKYKFMHVLKNVVLLLKSGNRNLKTNDYTKSLLILRNSEIT